MRFRHGCFYRRMHWNDAMNQSTTDLLIERSRILRALSSKKLLGHVLLCSAPASENGLLELSFSEQVAARGRVADFLACIDECDAEDVESLERLCRQAGLITM